MHYCVLLVTKELPSKDMIDEIMNPYYCETVYGNDDEDEDRVINYPAFTWDWYELGGRYKAELKLRIDEKDEKYHWGYYSRKDRNGRLFYSSLLSTLKEYVKPEWRYREENWFMNMGYGDGFLYVDGAKISDIMNLDDLGCYICIKPSGEAIARSSWNGTESIKNPNFDEEFKRIITDNMDGFITVLDIHD